MSRFPLAGSLAALVVSLASFALAGRFGGEVHLGNPDFFRLPGGARDVKQSALPAEPRRIVSSALVADELLLELVPLARLAAVSYVVDWPDATPVGARFPPGLRRVSGRVEELIALAPDLVLLSDYNPVTTSMFLRNAGIAVVRVPSPQDLAGLFAAARLLGRLTGSAPRAEALIRDWQAELARIASLPRPQPPPTALALAGSYAFGPGSLQDECLRHAGYRNALADPRRVGTRLLNSERVLALDPDLLFVAASITEPRRALLDDLPPGLPWSSLRAVRKQSMFALPAASMGSLTHHALAACAAYAAFASEPNL
jgi:iron complex transport system substrate-binding protein